VAGAGAWLRAGLSITPIDHERAAEELDSPQSCRRLNQARSSISLRRDARCRCHTRSHMRLEQRGAVAFTSAAIAAAVILLITLREYLF
jgi:uncharacterized paraquat-inducible protein A